MNLRNIGFEEIYTDNKYLVVRLMEDGTYKVSVSNRNRSDDDIINELEFFNNKELETYLIKNKATKRQITLALTIESNDIINFLERGNVNDILYNDQIAAAAFENSDKFIKKYLRKYPEISSYLVDQIFKFSNEHDELFLQSNYLNGIHDDLLKNRFRALNILSKNISDCFYNDKVELISYISNIHKDIMKEYILSNLNRYDSRYLLRFYKGNKEYCTHIAYAHLFKKTSRLTTKRQIISYYDYLKLYDFDMNKLSEKLNIKISIFRDLLKTDFKSNLVIKLYVEVGNKKYFDYISNLVKKGINLDKFDNIRMSLNGSGHFNDYRKSFNAYETTLESLNSLKYKIRNSFNLNINSDSDIFDLLEISYNINKYEEKISELLTTLTDKKKDIEKAEKRLQEIVGE